MLVLSINLATTKVKSQVLVLKELLKMIVIIKMNH